ncbi:MAG TPA: hypothetical protein VKQ52_13345, partial [Puia sp.]|nr:hypothetical protein [Puia sp.]
MPIHSKANLPTPRWHDFFILHPVMRHPILSKGKLLLFTCIILIASRAMSQDGKALFQTNCAQCHNPI